MLKLNQFSYLYLLLPLIVSLILQSVAAENLRSKAQHCYLEYRLHPPIKKHLEASVGLEAFFLQIC